MGENETALPSLEGKGEGGAFKPSKHRILTILLPSPARGGAGGEVKPISLSFITICQKQTQPSIKSNFNRSPPHPETLERFGEAFTAPCNNCDNCLRGIVVEKNPQLEPFPLNSRVTHSSWGEGLVMRYEGDKIVILFDTVGYKTLAVELTLKQGLLSLV